MLLCSRLWSERLEHLGSLSVSQFAKDHHQELQRWLSGQNGYQVLRVPAASLTSGNLITFVETHRQLGNQWCHPSQLLERFPIHEGDVPPGSCQTPLEDFWSGNFFAPWGPHNPAWDLSQQAMLGLEQLQDRLDELLSSTTFVSATEDELRRLRQLVEWFKQL